ncbi:hypothetical protein [Streptomyces capoamus]|uniref:hypothetical protein n=1 Tax=Streptomyces capoamus TaxID=68183 RepID=UPI00339B5C2B
MSNALLPLGMAPTSFLNPPLLSQVALGELQCQARKDLAVGAVPVLPVARRCQQRVLTRVCDQLWQEAEDGARLYVLDFAGPAPRVKIGRARSTAHLIRRIRGHLREKNKHGYGLVDAHVTLPATDVIRAEKQALQWMSYGYQRAPHTQEEFLGADFVIAEACADMGVFRYNPQEEDD